MLIKKPIYTLEPGIASREGGHIYENISGTLRANAGDNSMSVAYVIDSIGGQAEYYTDKDMCGCLKATHYKSPPCVVMKYDG